MRETSPHHARPGRAAVWAATGLGGIGVLLQAALFALEGGGNGRPLWGDEISYLAAARRLLQGLPSDLDPLWPPLYPHLLAALGGSRLAVEIAQALLLLATALLWADVARRSYGGDRNASALAGAIAGGLLLADAQVAAFAHYLWPETVHLFLFVAALWGLLRLATRSEPEGSEPGLRPRARILTLLFFAAIGATLGLALLAKSLLLPFLPVLFWPLVRRIGWRRALIPLAVAGVALCAVLLPTLLANALSGIGFRLADSSRFNLWVGLNDTSRRNLVGEIVGREYEIYRTSSPSYPEREAILAEKLRHLRQREGLLPLAARQLERQPFRLFDRDSFFTDQLPGGAIVVSGYGYRGVPPWTVGLLRFTGVAVYVLVLLGALFGIARGRSPWREEAAPFRPVLLAFLAYNLLLFLALHVKTRYRIQMMPALDLFAAFGFVGLWERANLSRRAAMGTLAAALLVLGLVFGGRALDARWPQAPFEVDHPRRATP